MAFQYSEINKDEVLGNASQFSDYVAKKGESLFSQYGGSLSNTRDTARRKLDDMVNSPDRASQIYEDTLKAANDYKAPQLTGRLFSPLASQVSKTYQDQVRGGFQLPTEVRNQMMQQSLERSGQGGFGGATAGNLSLRDLGVNQLDYMRDVQNRAGAFGQWETGTKMARDQFNAGMDFDVQRYKTGTGFQAASGLGQRNDAMLSQYSTLGRMSAADLGIDPTAGFAQAYQMTADNTGIRDKNRALREQEAKAKKNKWKKTLGSVAVVAGTAVGAMFGMPQVGYALGSAVKGGLDSSYENSMAGANAAVAGTGGVAPAAYQDPWAGAVQGGVQGYNMGMAMKGAMGDMNTSPATSQSGAVGSAVGIPVQNSNPSIWDNLKSGASAYAQIMGGRRDAYSGQTQQQSQAAANQSGWANILSSANNYGYGTPMFNGGR